MKLFHYKRADHALKTIETKLWKVSNFRELNDPFDLRPGVKYDKTKYPDPAFVESVLEGWTEWFVSQYKNLGLVCFSAEINDPVLWSHYADSHKGVAFELDITPREGYLEEIGYSDERPCYDLEELRKVQQGQEASGKFKEMGKRLFKNKAKKWSYESEYRFLIPLEKCACREGNYFIPFTPEQLPLKKVILGKRCAMTDDYMRHSLEHHGFKGVQVARARYSLDEYKILV